MNDKKNFKQSQGGRIPKKDPATRRHVFYLNGVDEAKFLSLFEQSGQTVMAHFITACIFDKPLKVIKMQQEDDLRGLAKIMEFMRAISILFVIIHIYWFCYESIREMDIHIGVVDKILLNFQHTAGLFSHILWTKLFAILFLALFCLRTKGVKEENLPCPDCY